jgi:hypothetical protein
MKTNLLLSPAVEVEEDVGLALEEVVQVPLVRHGFAAEPGQFCGQRVLGQNVPPVKQSFVHQPDALQVALRTLFWNSRLAQGHAVERMVPAASPRGQGVARHRLVCGRNNFFGRLGPVLKRNSVLELAKPEPSCFVCA